MDAPSTRLTLPARVQSVREFHQFAREGAAAVGMAAAEMDKLDLVLEEILVNIARYAYEGGAGDIEVSYSADTDGLMVQVIDQGRSFNPLEAAPPDLTLGLADRPVGGLGVLLVKQIVGSLDYRRENGKNTLSFRFPRALGLPNRDR
jgi:anti-sigma regulatory factor (Ser/Thr protein kinase)